MKIHPCPNESTPDLITLECVVASAKFRGYDLSSVVFRDIAICQMCGSILFIDDEVELLPLIGEVCFSCFSAHERKVSDKEGDEHSISPPAPDLV